MCEETGLELDDFFAEGGELVGELVVFGAEDFDFLLQVGEPLFFALAAFEGRDTKSQEN